METKQEYNRKINQLYRQLGKEIYEENQVNKLNHKQKNIVKRINHNIKLIKSLVSDEVHDSALPKGAIILEPEANEDGLMMYLFCPHCQTGNNPKSTHCIKCNDSLK